VPGVGEALGFSDSHTLLPVVDAFGEAGAVAARLEQCGIVCGGVPVPSEYGTHGLRVGVQEVTRWGMTVDDVPEVADCLVAGLSGRDKEKVRELAHRFSRVRFALGTQT
jgi:glycine hydroxymethyltransferase